jgi:hypothetical protein
MQQLPKRRNHWRIASWGYSNLDGLTAYCKFGDTEGSGRQPSKAEGIKQPILVMGVGDRKNRANFDD